MKSSERAAIFSFPAMSAFYRAALKCLQIPSGLRSPKKAHLAFFFTLRWPKSYISRYGCVLSARIEMPVVNGYLLVEKNVKNRNIRSKGNQGVKKRRSLGAVLALGFRLAQPIASEIS